MKRIPNKLIIPLLTIGLLISSCNTSRTVKGGAIGAAAGGAIGAVVGKKAGSTAVGAIVGAAVGGTAGALIGRKMDKQAEELRRDLEGATVTRVGEGILITFGDKLLFGFDSDELKAAAATEINDLAAVLNKYADTDILVEGHTDNIGKESYNQELSERRAKAVYRKLTSAGVRANRIRTIGYGESQPFEDNSTEAGRAQNRRVEIAIYANDKMKKAAKKGDL